MKDQNLEKARQWYKQQQKNRAIAEYEGNHKKSLESNKEFSVREAVKALPGGAISAIPDTAIGLLNLGLYGAEKGAQAFGVPEELAKTPSIPYYGNQFATQLTNKVFGEPQTQNELEGRNTGGLLGSLLVGNPASLATAPAKLSGKLINSLIKLNPKKAEAFKAAGLQPTLADVADRGLIKHAQSAVFSGINPRAEQRGKKLNSFFEGLEPIDLNQTGKLTTSGAKKYNEKASSIFNKLSDKAWKNIDRTEFLPLTNTIETIRKELQAITPEAQAKLAKTQAGQELTELVEAASNYEGSLPFSDVAEVYKSPIGKLIDVGELGDKEQKALKRAYGAIAQDIDDFVLSRDPSALKDIKKANKFWHNFSEGNRKITNEAISKNKTSDIATFNEIKNSLARGETRQGDVLTKRLNKAEKKQFSDTLIHELGRKDGEFSPFVWANNFNKWRPEAQKIALSGLDKEHSNKLMNVAKALVHVKDTGKYGNFSNTSNNAAALATLIGAWKAPLETAQVVGTLAITGELFANPKVIDALYAASKVKTKDQFDKVVKHYLPIMTKLAAQNKQTENETKDKNEDKLNQAREWYKSQQGAQNIINPVANTETRGESDTLATKPFKKSTRAEREEEQGSYSFGSQD
jgi:hypothetical protein